MGSEQINVFLEEHCTRKKSFLDRPRFHDVQDVLSNFSTPSVTTLDSGIGQ